MYHKKRGYRSKKMKIFSRPIPDGKTFTGFIEIGEFNNKGYTFEDTVKLSLLADGSVWARVANSYEDLPDVID
jgi:hypothetical protein